MSKTARIITQEDGRFTVEVREDGRWVSSYVSLSYDRARDLIAAIHARPLARKGEAK